MTDTTDQGDPEQQPGAPVTQRQVAELREETGNMLVGEAGIMPRTFAEVWKIAGVLWVSGLAPDSLKSREQITVAIMKGLELGVPPIAAMSGIAVINGRPALYGDLVMAKIRQSGMLEKFEEHFEGDPATDDFMAVCTMKRRGEDPITSTYSIADARTAKLWGKTNRNGTPTPWVTNWKRMLKFRARHFTSRDAFQDLLMGMAIYEELRDQLDVERDAVSVQLPASAPAAPMIEHERKSWPAPDFEVAKWAVKEVIDYNLPLEAMANAIKAEPGMKCPDGYTGPVLLTRQLDSSMNGVFFFPQTKPLEQADDREPAIKVHTPRERIDRPDQKPEPETEREPEPEPKSDLSDTQPEPEEDVSWSDRLDAFSGRVREMAHDTLIYQALSVEQHRNPPPTIARKMKDIADRRVRELDGIRGPAVTKEQTPDEQASGAPAAPAAPSEPIEEGPRTRPDQPDDAGKAGFANAQDRERAVEREALLMRKAKTVEELEAMWSNLQRDFFDRYVITNEDRDSLEQVFRGRLRLLKRK